MDIRVNIKVALPHAPRHFPISFMQICKASRAVDDFFGCFLFQGNCFQYQFLEKQLVNWYSSRKLCQARGGDLAVLNTRALQEKVLEIYSKHTRGALCMAIGLRRSSFYSNTLYWYVQMFMRREREGGGGGGGGAA